MNKKTKSPRQTLLARKKAKPVKVRVDGDWYAKAYERFSISAKAHAMHATHSLSGSAKNSIN